MGVFEVGLNILCIMRWSQAYGGQGVEGGGLNEDGPNSLICLDTWSPV